MRLLTTTRRRPRGPVHDGARGAPLVLALPAAAALLLLALPVAALLARAPWTRLPDRLAEPALLGALWLSLVTSAVATLGCVLTGVPLAWMLARVGFRGRRAFRGLVRLALLLPPVAGGVALLLALGPKGSYALAVVCAQAFVALPFLVCSVEGALLRQDARVEEAGVLLGGSRWTVFRTVTLPPLAPAIGVAALLCWARALGEFGATLVFAGAAAGTTPAAPAAVYLGVRGDPEAAVVLSLALLAVAATVLACLRDRWADPA
ncbi:molybdate ABC transporter permease [Sphaerisporangium melleum]|uniref:Molybdate ABC transporter permease n=1 Tax=Sphaerisporangium melleum TaxID=321316 RepID=A0A917VK95_9ACTN|nr:ABC transporter permease [Sphaerisporangium melleum]GGK89797.1 molybdate ABC transporter permease [Sphaerisporangium melleum]GII72541.1 molybdate ABC transporter permease [Sphaerisporangium melleum]